MNWYKKSFPTIKVVQAKINDVVSSVKSIDGVSDVYVWGSYLQKEANEDSIIRDVDLIAKTNFFSEDLSAIMDDEYSPLKIASSELEEEGFDPKAVKFTKEFLAINPFTIDHWAISSDEKIMHWGSVVSDKEEWLQMRKEAEDYACFELNINKKQFKKASNATKEKWFILYNHYVNKYLKKIPNGWYELECDFKEATKHIKKIS